MPSHSAESVHSGVFDTPKHSNNRLGWLLFALSTAAFVCLPIAAVVLLAFNPTENIWPHLASTVLPGYVLTTLALMAGVAIGTLLIGVTSAWFVTHYQFPGRKLFAWALLLPFAVPAYVIAHVYTDLLEYAGPLQSLLRDVFDWQSAKDYHFPNIRSLGGAIAMLVLVLYPYVYLLARSAFLEQSASILEAAQALGLSPRERLFRIALPMARPAIAVGLAMALMETLNDFGTVDYFAVRTLSAGLYDVWLGMGNLGGGAQIATLMLLFVLCLVGLEKASRRARSHVQAGLGGARAFERIQVKRSTALLITLFCAIPVTLGFLIPAIVLARYAVIYFDVAWESNFLQIAWNSIFLSTLAAVAAVTLGLLLSYSKRLMISPALNTAVQVSSLGYAIPGAVLAIGVMIPFTSFDNALDAFMTDQFGISTGLLLSGSIAILVFAYTVRFLAVAHGGIDASMKKISPHMDDAARSLGHSSVGILTRVHLPLMRGSLLTAALVVFVDGMKELPATLVLRPFNFDTLATQVYQFASDELIGESAMFSLLIVLVGLLPVVLLSTTIDSGRDESVHR